MAFPLSYRGKIECGSRAGTAALLDSMSGELHRVGLQNVFVWSSGISFGGATAQYGIKENEGNKQPDSDLPELHRGTPDGLMQTALDTMRSALRSAGRPIAASRALHDRWHTIAVSQRRTRAHAS